MKKIAIAMLVVGMFAGGAARANETGQEAANRKLVVEFYERVLNQKDVNAIDEYVGPYTQHNPGAADGPQGLKGFIGFMREKMPNSHSEIKRAFADGDYVILHVHSVREPGQRGLAIVDIFRLDKGKIVEHWDVIQAIPEQAANGNGMF